MAASDRDDDLDRLINAGPGAAADSDAGDTDLEQLAALAQSLRVTGRDHARTVDPVVGWAALSAAIEQTPQARPHGILGLLRGAASALQPQFAPFPAIASAAVILGFSLLLAMPHESASAALLRDVDAIERAVATASAHGTLSDDDVAALERTASAVLERVADDATLRAVPPSQVEAIVVRLDEARRTLSSLPDGGSGPRVGALVSLSAASGLVESSLSAIVAPSTTPAPQKAAPKTTPKPIVTPTASAALGQTATPTSTPVRAVTSTPTPRPVRSEDGPGASGPGGTGSTGNSGKDGKPGDPTPTSRSTAPVAPSVATLLDTVSPVCGRVYDTSTLGGCRKAVEAALLWCDQLASDGAKGCSSTVGAPLQAAERRVTSLSDGCKQLSSSRSQQACRDSIEKSSSRTSRGSSGNTGKGDRGD